MHEVNDSGSLGISILFFTFDGHLAQIMFSPSHAIIAVGYMLNECWYRGPACDVLYREYGGLL